MRSALETCDQALADLPYFASWAANLPPPAAGSTGPAPEDRLIPLFARAYDLADQLVPAPASTSRPMDALALDARPLAEGLVALRAEFNRAIEDRAAGYVRLNAALKSPFLSTRLREDVVKRLHELSPETDSNDPPPTKSELASAQAVTSSTTLLATRRRAALLLAVLGKDWFDEAMMIPRTTQDDEPATDLQPYYDVKTLIDSDKFTSDTIAHVCAQIGARWRLLPVAITRKLRAINLSAPGATSSRPCPVRSAGPPAPRQHERPDLTRSVLPDRPLAGSAHRPGAPGARRPLVRRGGRRDPLLPEGLRTLPRQRPRTRSSKSRSRRGACAPDGIEQDRGARSLRSGAARGHDRTADRRRVPAPGSGRLARSRRVSGRLALADEGGPPGGRRRVGWSQELPGHRATVGSISGEARPAAHPGGRGRPDSLQDAGNNEDHDRSGWSLPRSKAPLGIAGHVPSGRRDHVRSLSHADHGEGGRRRRSGRVQPLWRGRGALAIVLDCSGSMAGEMGRSADGTPITKYQEATAALRQVLRRVNRGTEVSLWVFGEAMDNNSTATSPEQTIVQKLPPTRWDPDDSSLIDRVMTQVEPPALQALERVADRPLDDRGARWAHRLPGVQEPPRPDRRQGQPVRQGRRDEPRPQGHPDRAPGRLPELGYRDQRDRVQAPRRRDHGGSPAVPGDRGAAQAGPVLLGQGGRSACRRAGAGAPAEPAVLAPVDGQHPGRGDDGGPRG